MTPAASTHSLVIPALGAGIHALGAARQKGVNPRTKFEDDDLGVARAVRQKATI
jgi:hypothetical protein